MKSPKYFIYENSIYTLVALLQICGQTTLAGSITDAKTGEPLMFADVIIYNQNGALITGGQTDIAGDYYVKDLEPGVYNLVFRYVGYKKTELPNVKLEANSVNYVDEVLSSGVTLAPVLVLAYGNRRVEVDHTCCCYPLTKGRKLEVEISIKYPENTVYPNPASSHFNIQSQREIKDASIFNLSGQLVKTLNVGQTQVDVSDLLAGTYFLIITEGTIVQTEKIVIVRN